MSWLIHVWNTNFSFLHLKNPKIFSLRRTIFFPIVFLDRYFWKLKISLNVIPKRQNGFIAPWGLWCRGLRFFMFVCLSVVCLSRSELIQNGTRKSASSEGTMEKFGPKTVPFLDISCRISPVTSVTSLKMQWVSNYWNVSPLHHWTQGATHALRV